MSTKSASTTPGMKITKVENTMPAPTAAATLNGENDVSTPSKSTKVCELHKDVSIWRAELLTQTFIGCWRCAMDQAWESPPDTRQSTQQALSYVLALIKGKKEREACINEVLGILFEEGERDKLERESLRKRMEALQSESRESETKWKAASSRVKELEKDEEKLTKQLDKMLTRIDALEAEKEEIQKGTTVLEEMLQQGEKERMALRDDAADSEKRAEELRCQLAAVQEQSRLATSRLEEELAAALARNNKNWEQLSSPVPSSSLHLSPTGLPQSQVQFQQAEPSKNPYVSTWISAADQHKLETQRFSAWQPSVPSATAGAVTLDNKPLPSSNNFQSLSHQPQRPQEDQGLKEPDDPFDVAPPTTLAPGLSIHRADGTVSNTKEKGEGTVVDSTPTITDKTSDQDLGEDGGKGNENENTRLEKKKNPIGALFGKLTSKNPAEVGTARFSGRSLARGPGEDKSSSNIKPQTKVQGPASSSSPSSPASNQSPPRPKISVIAHMDGQERVAFTMYQDDRFQKVMERYLQVKDIKAPVDEVRFVVDANHHTLGPELTPMDFDLKEGATISVRVPAEYVHVKEVTSLSGMEEGKEGGKEERGMDEAEAYM